jgi:hypothetical protein
VSPANDVSTSKEADSDGRPEKSKHNRGQPRVRSAVCHPIAKIIQKISKSSEQVSFVEKDVQRTAHRPIAHPTPVVTFTFDQKSNQQSDEIELTNDTHCAYTRSRIKVMITYFIIWYMNAIKSSSK